MVTWINGSKLDTHPARKARQCDICVRMIEVGEDVTVLTEALTYERGASSWVGTAHYGTKYRLSHSLHPACFTAQMDADLRAGRYPHLILEEARARANGRE